MNTPDQPSPDATLTPEERALAQRLAQTRPPHEPAPALDARILAAARAAATGSSNTRTQRRIRRRWPAVAGVAATMVLALGLAWQLRPLDDTRIEYSQAPRAVMPASADRQRARAQDEAPQAGAAAPARAPDAAERIDTEAAQGSAAQDSSARTSSVEQPAVVQRVEQQPAATEAPLVFDAPAPMQAPTPPPPSPAPAAPPSPQAIAPAPRAFPLPEADTSPERERIDRQQRVPREPARTQVPPAATSAAAAADAAAAQDPEARDSAAADASALDRIEVTGTRIRRFEDQPLHDRPPATADSPQVQQAWLQRVRELVAEGQLDAARDSLREYRRRYPQSELPEDLAALLAE